MEYARMGELVDDTPIPKTRMGYDPRELIKVYGQLFLQQGTIATGKIVHLTADIVCSGGYQVWKKFTYNYAFDHIGLASPRIFIYLQKRHEELAKQLDKYPLDLFYGMNEIQKVFAEMALVLQTQPRRTKPKIPVVPGHALQSDEWLAAQKRSPTCLAVDRVWVKNQDGVHRYRGANEMLAACEEGATERALFWMKWVLEEDAAIIKKGEGFQKDKRMCGMFIASCLAEAYKELVKQGKIRMNDEFQNLLDLFRKPEHGLAAKNRNDCLVLMTQIISEVPRWKVPAAAPLAKDPVYLSRIMSQAPLFFKEVLERPKVPDIIWKAKGKPQVDFGKKRSKEETAALTQQDALDKAMEAFYGKL
jgi:hypothetical protein